ncbi:hypothetical protein EJ08DRAFT_654400 [Tothia fuscella]|uniref:Calcineurin-like phosphoesterase domain-containing protein n=1 Tax=Tothia fuscella TaxID=1048955 RepID=A0A9P4TRU1_9PEZI|nr:hypothetical protein EJ08DRAFT_654400 [Tothia fuscella]
MSPTLVKTRFLIISDTHGYEAMDEKRSFRQEVPPSQVRLHCGDLTKNGIPEDYEKAINMLGSIDAELKLVIAGNHDLSLDRDFYEKNGGDMNEHTRAISIWDGPLAEEAGVTLLNEGLHSFTLKNGAVLTVYASPYTPVFGDSAFQYPTGEDRFNPSERVASEATSTTVQPILDFPGVDIVMTHGPPKYVLDETSNGSNAGCPHLRRAIQHARPRLHCFGHVRPQWGLRKVVWDQKGEEETDDGYTMLPRVFVRRNQMMRKRTAYQDLSSASEEDEHGAVTVMVNAAIMNENGEPANAPWLLDLDLPTA